MGVHGAPLGRVVAAEEGLTALHPSPDYVSDVIRASGDFYERAVLDHLRDRLALRAPGVIVDVGAMIGNHAVYLARYAAHSAIEAFEPWPDSLALLRANAAPYGTIRVHPVALADWTGVSGMTAEEGNLGHAFLADGSGVEVRTLDSFGFEDVSLVKIDVEGWEPNVLRGAWQTINRWHPLVAMEDWTGGHYGGGLPPGYRLAQDWSVQHQVYLYEWAA